ncbi:MAG TPA: polyprenyl synthetase family protein [Bacteroidales bacterium]|nr:polyprenyl synthetase family protein [Bacteroidales bacterium]
MRTLEDYRQMFEEGLATVDLNRQPANLYAPVQYIMGLGGKRLRPSLVLAACELCQGDTRDALMPALGMEFFHNFTLLHDDIMDQAPIRRGMPTVHVKWDINRAILSGDTMFALAGKLMLMTRPEALPAVPSLFFQTAMEVCEGQQMDMDFETRLDVSTSEYLDMIGLKTAVLIAACLKTGALVAGAHVSLADALYDFGYQCGIAFQLQDDYLDAFGEADFGKTQGGDITANKKTWLYLQALERADEELRHDLLRWYDPGLKHDADKITAVKEIFMSLGIPDQIRKLMLDYQNKALISLEKVEHQYGPAPVLRAFAAQVSDRKV